jgi:hypothetical protein
MALTGAAEESGAGSYVDNTTPTTLVTNSQGAGLIVRIDKLLLVNVNAASRTVQLYKVPSGGSISSDNWKILKDYTIDGLETLDIREAAGLMLENGDSLRCLASAASSIRFDLSYWKES